MNVWNCGRRPVLPAAAPALMALAAAAALHAATFSAALDRDTITLGESATLSLTFEGGSPQKVPIPPSVPGLQISYVGPSSQFSFINGQVSSAVTHHFTITPQRAGHFVIPSLEAVVGGQVLRSDPVELTVLQPNQPTAAQITSGSQVAFMTLALPERTVYPGEAVVAELKVYLRDDVQNFGNFQFTSRPADGFAIGKMAQGGTERAQIGRRVYSIIPISLELTAVKTGSLSVGPFTAEATILLPSPNQGGDPFFAQFFNTGEQKQISLITERLEVRSLPLPTNDVPADFNGAIGQYTLSVSAGPTNVAVGDPITVRVQISGRGALDALVLPDQPAWRDFKVYPPTSKLETDDRLGIEGKKTFEEIVSPENTDVHELPEFSFSFFDPDTGGYRSLRQPPVPLTVRPGGAVAAPTLASARPANAQPPAPGIVPIKDRLGALAQLTPPLVARPGFLAVQSLPLLAWLAALVWRKRTDSLANNPRLRRQRRVAQLVQDGLSELRRLAGENNSEEFFATLHHLLQEQLGERLDCPALSITDAAVEEKLRPRGASEATVAALRELFQICNQARYAPIKGSQELAAVAARFERVVTELQSLKA
ncbi:MAG: protein BatD [Verrucomicrobiota bacterium]|nr:protein BatD [Verrucomicrobiota bacterium]